MSNAASRPTTGMHGINVIGHLSSSAGLGVTARIFIELLRGRGIAVAEFDVDAAAGAPTSAANEHAVRHLDQLPFDHNLIVLSLNRLPKFWLRQGRAVLAPRFRNAGMLFWELPVIPPAWIPSLRMFDAVVTCSHYVRQAFETAIDDVPTVFAEHPLPRHVAVVSSHQRTAVRQRHGIPESALTFCCTFDPRSGIERKNPLGAITAWLDAFPSRGDVCLVVKSNGPPLHDDPQFATVLQRVRSDPRIVLVPDHLEQSDLLALFGSCDVIVSLHRAEGLGLVPMEGMALGKLVIATGYSGNMTYMTEQNSLPVPYRLIAPREPEHLLSRAFAGRGASWADPDLGEAARLMRRAADRPDEFAQLAARARSDIAARQVTAWGGGFIDEVERFLTASTGYAARAHLTRLILWQEVSNTALRNRSLRVIAARLQTRLRLRN